MSFNLATLRGWFVCMPYSPRNSTALLKGWVRGRATLLGIVRHFPSEGSGVG